MTAQPRPLRPLPERGREDLVFLSPVAARLLLLLRDDWAHSGGREPVHGTIGQLAEHYLMTPRALRRGIAELLEHDLVARGRLVLGEQTVGMCLSPPGRLPKALSMVAEVVS